MRHVDAKTTGPSSYDALQRGETIAYGAALHNEVMQFLIEEAHLLDDGLFNEWLHLLADDVQCIMPVRQSVSRNYGAGFDDGMTWVDEDKDSITFKVQRLYGDSAWAEDPPSRTRRLITNLRLRETETPGEYLAQSYLMIHRSRGDATAYEIFSARRDDIVRRTDAGWRLAKRTILVDQAALGLANLAIFL